MFFEWAEDAVYTSLWFFMGCRVLCTMILEEQHKRVHLYIDNSIFSIAIATENIHLFLSYSPVFVLKV